MLIAISGGIGSGKSIVARMLEALGYSVYDCDSKARQLIDSSIAIKEAIASELGAQCITSDGSVNRKAVSDIVFNDSDKLDRLNAITHAAVRDDLTKWSDENSDSLKFVETAILYQSGIDNLVDGVIEVTAPIEVRVARINRRNNLGYNDIMRRIEAQNFKAENPHPIVYTVRNDDITAVLPQLQSILDSIGRALDSEVIGIIAKG